MFISNSSRLSSCLLGGVAALALLGLAGAPGPNAEPSVPRAEPIAAPIIAPKTAGDLAPVVSVPMLDALPDAASSLASEAASSASRNGKTAATSVVGDLLPRVRPMYVPEEGRLAVPYRSQLDGTPYATANCGPVSLGMVLEGFGFDVSWWQIRQEVLDAQELWGDDTGVYMGALAQVGAQYGARVLDLYVGEGLKRWSVDDLRMHLKAGHPVILQVQFRQLPGRKGSLYDGDHFIVITGMTGDRFVYNDPLDSNGIGYDRLITADQLQHAMRTHDKRYTFAGFALAAP